MNQSFLTAILVTLFFTLSSAIAGDGKLTCQIHERTPTERVNYVVEVPSQENHTVHIYEWARIIPGIYLRISGVVGGGAHFLQFNAEDRKTGFGAISKGIDSGKLWFGTQSTSVDIQCRSVADSRG